MPSVNKSFGGLLKGSDVVKAGLKAVAGVVLNVRAGVKEVSSPYLVDFDTEILPGISCWPCNITEARRLSEMISDQTENWRGWMIMLVVTPKTNPKNGSIVDGLSIGRVMRPADAAKKRKNKPTITTEQARSATSSMGAPPEAPDWDKVPF